MGRRRFVRWTRDTFRGTRNRLIRLTTFPRQPQIAVVFVEVIFQGLIRQTGLSARQFNRLPQRTAIAAGLAFQRLQKAKQGLRELQSRPIRTA